MNDLFQKIIVFVGEYENEGNSWSTLISFIENDENLINKYSCVVFDYSDYFKLALHSPHRFLKDVSIQFMKFIEELRIDNENNDFVLVGHGIGGTIIQGYLQEKIEKNSLDEISYIRQLVFFSVPSYEVKYSGFLNKILNLSGRKNSIFKLTQNLKEKIKELRKLIKDRIILAEEFSSQAKPISAICFGSKEDKVVEEQSAKGEFNNYRSLIGNHQSIILPEDSQDLRFIEFKYVLLKPPVHQSIFEIECLKTTIKVEPIELKDYLVKHGMIERIVRTDNAGKINRKIKFSDRNICKDLFTLRYAIENEYGYISASTSGGQNETPETNIRKYDKRGLEYFFEFYPCKDLNQEYSLNVDLLDGFRETNRDAHFHLGKGRNRYQKLYLELDLSSFHMKGHSFSARLYFHPEDTHSCEYRFLERIPSHLVPQTQNDGKGLWVWEIEDVGGGVIDICWEIM